MIDFLEQGFLPGRIQIITGKLIGGKCGKAPIGGHYIYTFKKSVAKIHF
jgi:hypothetical protein